MSRFDRTPSKKPTEGETASIPQVPTVSPTPMSSSEIQALQERLKKLQERRMRQELQLENAKRALEECQKQAQQFGVETLQELEEKVRVLTEEDARERAAFVQALDQEEELLNSIDRQLAQLEQ